MSGRQSSATERALRHVAGGMLPSLAAIREGLAPSTLYRAIKSQAAPAYGGNGSPKVMPMEGSLKSIPHIPLLSLQEIMRRATPMPLVRGIYFLIRGDEIIYVGQTPNIFRRLGEHLRNKVIDAYYLEPCEGSQEELTLLERRYIDIFLPPLNKQKNFWQNIPQRGGGALTAATKDALALVAQGYSGYAAAKKCRINVNTIYRALKAQRRTVQGSAPESAAERTQSQAPAG